MGRPIISVVTPSYNDADYLPSCLESIATQSYKEIEHIVVDGNSTDGTADLLRDWATKLKDDETSIDFDWSSEPDDGMYDAIETGFERASGDVYCWLNADDRWFPWTTSIVAEVFRETDVEWVTGHPTRLDSDGRVTSVTALRPHYRRSWIKKGWYYKDAFGSIQQESTFWTQDLWERADGFREDVELAGDYWLWRDFAREAKLVTVDTVLGTFRTRGPGETQQSGDMSAYLGELERSRLAEALDRLYVQEIYSIWYGLNSTSMSRRLAEIRE